MRGTSGKVARARNASLEVVWIEISPGKEVGSCTERRLGGQPTGLQAGGRFPHPVVLPGVPVEAGDPRTGVDLGTGRNRRCLLVG